LYNIHYYDASGIKRNSQWEKKKEKRKRFVNGRGAKPW
jgi:hypothetical protein